MSKTLNLYTCDQLQEFIYDQIKLNQWFNKNRCLWKTYIEKKYSDSEFVLDLSNVIKNIDYEFNCYDENYEFIV